MKNFILILFLSVTFVGQIISQETNNIVNLDIEKLKKIEKQIQSNDSSANARIKELESRLNSSNFVAILKKANVEKFKNDVSILKNRYLAGEEILNHIIRETNSFNLSYQQLVMQNEFSDLTNPTNYPEFTNPLRTTLNSLGDKKPIPDISADLSNLKQNIPYLNNPVVNSGLSMVSYFIAKYNDKRKFESESFKKMTCVLDFTSKTESEYKLNIQRITVLRDKIETFNSNIKNFFALYLKAIGYNDGYSSYIANRNNSGSDFLDNQRLTFFNSILSDTSAVGVVSISTSKDDNVSYYIEQVKFFIAEYESIIRDIDNSITSYDLFYNNLNSNLAISCEGIKSFAMPKLSKVNDNLNKVKAAFKIVNEENKIPANLKRTLLGL